MPASIMKLTCPTCSQSKSEPEPAATQLKLLLPTHNLETRLQKDVLIFLIDPGDLTLNIPAVKKPPG